MAFGTAINDFGNEYSQWTSGDNVSYTTITPEEIMIKPHGDVIQYTTYTSSPHYKPEPIQALKNFLEDLL